MFDLAAPYEIAFKTIGHDWTLRFHEINPEGFAYGLMTREPHQTEPIWFGMGFEEMIGMERYFERHLAQLRKNPSHRSKPIRRFMTPFGTRLTRDIYNLQALGCEASGGADAHDPGRFQLKFTCQRYPYPRPYLDESVLTETGLADISDCRAFASELRLFVEASIAALFKAVHPGKLPADLDDGMRIRLMELIVQSEMHTWETADINSSISIFWMSDRKVNIWTQARFDPQAGEGASKQWWAREIIRVVKGERGGPPDLPPPYIAEAEFTGGGNLPALELTTPGRFPWSARYWRQRFQESKERARRRFRT